MLEWIGTSTVYSGRFKLHPETNGRKLPKKIKTSLLDDSSSENNNNIKTGQKLQNILENAIKVAENEDKLTPHLVELYIWTLSRFNNSDPSGNFSRIINLAKRSNQHEIAIEAIFHILLSNNEIPHHESSVVDYVTECSRNDKNPKLSDRAFELLSSLPMLLRNKKPAKFENFDFTLSNLDEVVVKSLEREDSSSPYKPNSWTNNRVIREDDDDPFTKLRFTPYNILEDNLQGLPKNPSTKSSSGENELKQVWSLEGRIKDEEEKKEEIKKVTKVPTNERGLSSLTEEELFKSLIN